MQNKKNRNILFSKDNSAKNRSKLSKLVEKYPFSLNLLYKHVEFSALHDKVLDPVDLKRLSAYSIDKQFLKMKFKKLNKQEDSYWLNSDASQPSDQAIITPEESVNAEKSIDPIEDIIDLSEVNQLDQTSVKQEILEQNTVMAAKNKDDKLSDEDPQVAHFTEWLEGLKKSKKSDDDNNQTPVDEKKKKKKKKKKDRKKDKKLKAKRKQKLEQAEIISETLAELMAKQGYTEKAIEMYNRLSLLFPEKNSYFARKIEDLNN